MSYIKVEDFHTIRAKRVWLQAGRRKDGDTPELICKEISAFIEELTGHVAVAGCYGGIPHWFNLAEDGTVIDGSPDQFKDNVDADLRCVLVGNRNHKSYLWYDAQRRAYVEDGLGEPVQVDPLFDEHKLFRPIAEHPIVLSPDPDMPRYVRALRDWMRLRRPETTVAIEMLDDGIRVGNPYRAWRERRVDWIMEIRIGDACYDVFDVKHTKRYKLASQKELARFVDGKSFMKGVGNACTRCDGKGQYKSYGDCFRCSATGDDPGLFKLNQ